MFRSFGQDVSNIELVEEKIYSLYSEETEVKFRIGLTKTKKYLVIQAIFEEEGENPSFEFFQTKLTLKNLKEKTKKFSEDSSMDDCYQIIINSFEENQVEIKDIADMKYLKLSFKFEIKPLDINLPYKKIEIEYSLLKLFNIQPEKKEKNTDNNNPSNENENEGKINEVNSTEIENVDKIDENNEIKDENKNDEIENNEYNDNNIYEEINNNQEENKPSEEIEQADDINEDNQEKYEENVENEGGEGEGEREGEGEGEGGEYNNENENEINVENNENEGEIVQHNDEIENEPDNIIEVNKIENENEENKVENENEENKEENIVINKEENENEENIVINKEENEIVINKEEDNLEENKEEDKNEINNEEMNNDIIVENNINKKEENGETEEKIIEIKVDTNETENINVNQKEEEKEIIENKEEEIKKENEEQKEETENIVITLENTDKIKENEEYKEEVNKESNNNNNNNNDIPTNNEIIKDENEINKYIEQEKILNDKINELLKKIESLEKDNDSLKKENSKLKEENSKVKNDNTSLGKEKNALKNEKELIGKENTKIKKENETLKKEKNTLIKEKESLKKENSKLTSENKSYKDKLSKANLTEEKLKKANKENNDLKVELQKLKNEANKNTPEKKVENKNKKKDIGDIIDNAPKRQKTEPTITVVHSLENPKIINKSNKKEENKENKEINKKTTNPSANKNKIEKTNSFISVSPINLKLTKTLTQSSYIEYSIDNAFDAFESLSGELLLVYATKFKSIECFDLVKQKFVKTILNAHNSMILIIKHYCPKYQDKDIILSSSNNPDFGVKIWDIQNWSCIYNLNKVYEKGNMLAVCILFDEYQKESYIFTSNDFGSIKIWGMDGKHIKNINKTENNETYFLDTYYDKTELKYFLIAGEMKFVKSYELSTHQLFRTYIDANSFAEHTSAFVYKNGSVTELVECEFYGYIRTWNFHTGNLIKKIEISKRIPLVSMCLWNKNYLLVSCVDHTIKLVDFKNLAFIKSFKGHNNEVCTIKKIVHPTYGECLISQGLANEQIKMWTN